LKKLYKNSTVGNSSKEITVPRRRRRRMRRRRRRTRRRRSRKARRKLGQEASNTFLLLAVHLSRIRTVNPVGSEVLTAVVMTSTIFWVIMPCSSLEVNRLFGGTYRIHLQGQRINYARYQRERR
jgi:hypothetical protein